MPTNDSDDLLIAARIRAHVREQMHDRSLSGAEVARMIDADKSSVYKLLAGERIPRIGQILRICKGLRITPSRLLEGDPPAKFWDRHTRGVIRIKPEE